jgi:hypothetical protein
VGERDDEIVSVLFVHSRQNLVKFGSDGGMVKHSPVKEGIGPRCVGRELGGTTGCHDSYVVREEPFRSVKSPEDGDDVLDLSVGTGVVIAKIPHEERSV